MTKLITDHSRPTTIVTLTGAEAELAALAIKELRESRDLGRLDDSLHAIQDKLSLAGDGSCGDRL